MGNSENFVSVCKVYDSIKAELIQSKLESEGIMAIQKADNAGGSLSYLTTTIGIEILVHREDKVRADQIIQEIA